MPWIAVIADALGVVEDREQNDDGTVGVGRPRGEVETDRSDMPPVILAVEDRRQRR